MGLEGKVNVVTGAVRDQGAAEMTALLAAGADVIACDGGQSAHGGAKYIYGAERRETAA